MTILRVNSHFFFDEVVFFTSSQHLHAGVDILQNTIWEGDGCWGKKKLRVLGIKNEKEGEKGKGKKEINSIKTT